MKGSAKLLMLAIADSARDNGYAYPGEKFLAKKMDMSERQIRRLVCACEESGELRVIRKLRYNEYWIDLPIPDKMTGVLKPEKDRTGDILGRTPDILGRTPDTAMSSDSLLDISIHHTTGAAKPAPGHLSKHVRLTDKPIQPEEEAPEPSTGSAEPEYVDLDYQAPGKGTHRIKADKTSWLQNEVLDLTRRTYFDSLAQKNKLVEIEASMHESDGKEVIGQDPLPWPKKYVEGQLAWVAGMNKNGTRVNIQGIITAITNPDNYQRWLANGHRKGGSYATNTRMGKAGAAVQGAGLRKQSTK
jgi:hypothetical protein